jgi:TrmH family RNA methyltransferase
MISKNKLKELAVYKQQKRCDEDSLFVVEGVKMCEEILAANVPIKVVCATNSWLSQHPIVPQCAELFEVDADALDRLSGLRTPNEVWMLLDRNVLNGSKAEGAPLVLALDHVQDPGNLGTLFRTSLGFGSDGMVLGRGTVSPFNPKVVRGSSGTFLRVPFEFDIDLIDHINFLRSKGYTIIATDLHAKQTLRDIPARKLRKMAFLVGNEGAGTNPYFIEIADETVKIPMSSELESLNVSVAHGILSYEAAQIQEELK